MGGGDIMAGSRQPIELVMAKGKKHLSKEEIKERMESEIHAPSDNIEIPSYLTKSQKAKFEFYASQLLDLNIMSNLDSEALAKYITTNDMDEMVTKKLRTSEVKNNISLFE